VNAAVVLLSGGQDSTTCLYWALQRFEKVHTMSVFYGQRHAPEIDAAAVIAKAAHSHQVLLLPLQQVTSSALIDSRLQILPSGGHADAAAPDGLPTSFVPGRNMIMLSFAAALAVSVGARAIVTGVCETDYSGYPDCREDFVQSMQTTINLAMPSSIRLEILAPLMHLTKAQTIVLARMLGPACWDALALTVTCYEGKRPGCGECPACKLRAQGFAQAGEEDPANA
jgi:7-cyano-7-deazaguanine synthase